MYVAEKTREPAQVNAVALKAYARVADAWGLSLKEAAGLADMSESTWKRAKKPDFAGELTKDQLLRLSAVIGIYKSLESWETADGTQLGCVDTGEWLYESNKTAVQSS